MPAHATIRRDIVSAYLSAVVRMVSWIAVSALVARRDGRSAFALLALVRATLGLLNYATLGLAPAMIHLLPKSFRPADSPPNSPPFNSPPPNSPPPISLEGADIPILDYEPGKRVQNVSDSTFGPVARAIYCNGILLSWIATLLAGLLLAGYEILFTARHAAPGDLPARDVSLFVICMGIGTIFRLAGDPASALLQVRGQVAGDNFLLIAAELIWMIGSLLTGGSIVGVGGSYLIAGLVLWIARIAWGYQKSGILFPKIRLIRLSLMGALLSFGLMVAIAQAADFLYAPTDYLLIDHLLRPIDIATYAPAIQIDGGIWLLATALSATLLPHAALAHADDDHASLRKYYLRGTVACAAILCVACGLMWLLSPMFLRLWLERSMPETVALLPLVLINTVIGGSGAIGRAILLGTGKVRPFAIAVLVAGATNVIFSWAFVRFGGLGLRGIVLGTSVAVAGRCLLWMPWYVLRTLRQPAR